MSLINYLQSLVRKTIKAELLEYCQHPEKAFENKIVSDCIQEINSAHFHPYQAGGKLVRPLLMVLFAGCFGGNRGVSNSLSIAAAIECVHIYSLVHDDLPCMDNDSLRRGQPTVHTVYGAAKGLLVGDGLLTASFDILMHARSLDENIPHRSHLILQLTKILVSSAGIRGMIWGQWLDISESTFQNKLHSCSVEEVWKIFQEIHYNKTGKLFAASVVMGFLCGLSSVKPTLGDEKVESLKKEFFQLGLDIGLSFQIVDDILDQTQTTKQLGKTSDKDKTQNKFTAITVFGIEKAQELSNKLMKDILNKIEKNIFPLLHEDGKEYLDELINFLNFLGSRKY